MSTRDGRRASRGERKSEPGDRDEAELQDLLREAQEILRELEIPSGDWPAEGQKWSRGREPEAPLWGDPSPWEGIDPDVAFWLLFPPRGNA